MSNIQNKTCIKFKPRSAEPNYVKFNYRNNLCRSNVGMMGGMQELDYYDGCCVKNTVQHELLHLLGGVHEHLRPDRDQYINVHIKNINKYFVSHFDKYTPWRVNTYNQSFDDKSVMMYPSTVYRTNWRVYTMTRKSGNARIYSASEMSNTDWYKLKKHYCS
ncbi:Uncharacterised protein g2685 [Pycnogonum litorale]